MKARTVGFAIVFATVTMMAMAHVANAQIPAEIVGVEWQWRGTLLRDGTVIRPADPSNYTIEFGADENAAVRADCNVGGGSYTTAAGERMQIGPIITTLIACPPGSLDGLYLQQLDRVAGFRILGDDLVLSLESGLGWMRFTRADATNAAQIIGMWQWQGTLMNDGTAIVPADPTQYTLELMEDGRAVIRADCNNGFGGFATADNLITLGPFALTRALCPPGSLDTRFVRQLESVVSFLIVDGDLVLELPFDSGGMRFSAAVVALPAPELTGELAP
ncbi:MAG: META domain-containing protein [Dehalococcoidia bacterium]